jgi:hypothetical protein
MPAQRMGRWQSGVIEIAPGIVNQPDSFHHAAGGNIRRHGEGNNLIDLQRIEGVTKSFARALGGQSPVPMFGG